MDRLLDIANWIEGIVREFINNSPENTLKNEKDERAWSDPLVGFSRGDDPLYEDYQKHIGSFHWTPMEIFKQTFPDADVTPKDLTVISWILPQTEATKADSRKEEKYPPERWARARLYGEEVNNKLRKHVVDALQQKGHKAVSPMLSPKWSRQMSDAYGFASNWSERHAAYAAGLGTFGLCDGLITPRGKAVRVGSVIAQIRVPATPRIHDDHHAYCLFFTKGTCKKCISRCPVGAITESGHDKVKCYSHTYGSSLKHIKSLHGFEVGSCGLCQTKVPCESRIPTEVSGEK